MNITLFRAFRDPYRSSMAMYADTLERRIPPWLSTGESIQSVELPSPRLEGWQRYWDQYVRYQRLAGRKTSDVNHIVDHGYAHLLRSLPGERTIVSFHDAVVMKVPGVNWRTRRAFEYSVSCLTRAAAVVCDSEAARADLRSYVDLKEERVHVVPLGIDESFRPAEDRQLSRRRLGLSGDVVLVIGHTQAYMNVERMIRAFGQLVTQHGSEATLVKVGLPFEPDHMRLISELELGDRIRMVGRVPFADLPGYYHAADVLLYVPLLAGFGLPPLEAMACGTPVVASNRGAIPEVVGDGGVLVDADDDKAMADAMAEILTQPQKRRRLVERGFGRAARFEWSQTSRRMVELYRAVARG
jgi:glycosyltransferase involved in cell wall biosynthesis